MSESNTSKSQLGDFRLLKKLGEGGMGAVFKARQLSMDRDVALKVLPKHLARDQNFVDRFYREARASAKLDHRNIVRGLLVGEERGFHYFAMEYVDGVSSDKLLEQSAHLFVERAPVSVPGPVVDGIGRSRLRRCQRFDPRPIGRVPGEAHNSTD